MYPTGNQSSACPCKPLWPYYIHRKSNYVIYKTNNHYCCIIHRPACLMTPYPPAIQKSLSWLVTLADSATICAVHCWVSKTLMCSFAGLVSCTLPLSIFFKCANAKRWSGTRTRKITECCLLFPSKLLCISTTHRTNVSVPRTIDDPYPVATSHILSVLSLDADTRKSPEGMKLREETLWSWPNIVLIHSYVWKFHSRMDMSAEHEAEQLEREQHDNILF